MKMKTVKKAAVDPLNGKVEKEENERVEKVSLFYGGLKQRKAQWHCTVQLFWACPKLN